MLFDYKTKWRENQRKNLPSMELNTTVDLPTTVDLHINVEPTTRLRKWKLLRSKRRLDPKTKKITVSIYSNVHCSVKQKHVVEFVLIHL